MALLEKVSKNWNTVTNQPNCSSACDSYDGLYCKDTDFLDQGNQSAFPPPTQNAELMGPTICRSSSESINKEFDCNVGIVGLYDYNSVNTFRTNYDSNAKNYSLAAMDTKTGTVIEGSQGDNICKKAYDKDLEIDFGKFNSLEEAPITVLHKTWGNVRKKTYINGGTHVNNVDLPKNNITGFYYDDDGTKKSINQRCLRLTMRGSEYNPIDSSEASWGLIPVKVGGTTKYISTQNGQLQYEGSKVVLGPGQKVGACIGTEYMLGPGYYEVIAHAPDLCQYHKKKEGKIVSNGYCWAVWTFHYEEHYDQGPASQFIDPKASESGEISDGYCYNKVIVETPKKNVKEEFTGYQLGLPSCVDKDKQTPSVQSAYLPGKGDGVNTCYGDVSLYDSTPDAYLDYSTGVVNHEIDIEIPGSWPGKSSTECNNKYWTPSTWNCNTFIGANDTALARANWSSQYVIQKMKNENGEWSINESGNTNSFLSTPPANLKNPETENLEFHKYAFDWCVPDDGSKPYVEWFFDGKSIFKSYTMVPTRSSRLLVGGWFPHWVQEGNSDCKPDGNDSSLKALFDTAKIFVKSIKYSPTCFGNPDVKNKMTDFPQNYDQCGRNGNEPSASGFTKPNAEGYKLPNNIYAVEDTRVCDENCPFKTEKPKTPDSYKKLAIVIYIIVGISVAALIGILIYSLVSRKK